MLYILLPLSRQTHVIVTFGKYEPLQPVLFREAVNETGTMLPGTPG